MDQFLDFLREYWFQLAAGIFALLEIVLIIVKRKPKSLDDFKFALSEALSLVPEMVIRFEKSGNGAQKKADVISFAVRFISRCLGRSLTIDEVSYVSQRLSEKIETVLTTPTKKEGNINEK